MDGFPIGSGGNSKQVDKYKPDADQWHQPQKGRPYVVQIRDRFCFDECLPIRMRRNTTDTHSWPNPGL